MRNELLLFPETMDWKLSSPDITLAPAKKLFAPANLRSSKHNIEYATMMRYWMEEQYTLRYTGGMVPDIHNILIKGGGVFCNPISSQSPAKLRLLYECFPFALIALAAGGRAIDGKGDMDDRKLKHHDERSPICLGSKEEVSRCEDCLFVEESHG